MIVDDLEVSDSFSYGRSTEVDLRLCFTGSLRVNGEVSGFSYFNACREVTNNLDYHVEYHCLRLSSLYPGHSLTCIVESRSFCSDFSCIMGGIHPYFEGADRNFLFEHERQVHLLPLFNRKQEVFHLLRLSPGQQTAP